MVYSQLQKEPNNHKLLVKGPAEDLRKQLKEHLSVAKYCITQAQEPKLSHDNGRDSTLTDGKSSNTQTQETEICTLIQKDSSAQAEMPIKAWQHSKAKIFPRGSSCPP